MALAMTNVYVELQPIEDTWTPVLAEIQANLIDLAALYPRLWTIFRVIERRRFDAEGPGWQALAPSTVAGRVAMGIGGTGPILTRKGAGRYGDVDQVGGSLRKSFTTKTSKYSFFEPMPDGVFLGSKHPLAIYHQTGAHGAGKDHNVTIPARPIVDMNQANAELFSEAIAMHVFGFAVNRAELYDAEDTGAVEMVGSGV